jgi:nucleotide-binding universal stress UspA family protein
MHLLEKPARLMLQDILVVSTGPGPTDTALAHALGLAREHGARMHFAHTAWTGFDGNTKGSCALGSGAAELKDSVTGQRFAGDNLRGILEQNKFDLAVLNAAHTSGDAWPGEAARELLLVAHCPLLVLGPNIRPTEPLRSAPASVLHATDFSPQALAAAQHAFSWAQEYQASLTMLHVIEGVQPRTDEERDALAAPFRSWMNELVPDELPLWCEVEHRVILGEVAPSIAATARETGADLIVIGLSGLESAAPILPGTNTVEVVRQAECPVLIAGDYMNRSVTDELPATARSCAVSVAA